MSVPIANAAVYREGRLAVGEVPDNITLELILFGPRRFLPAAPSSPRGW